MEYSNTSTQMPNLNLTNDRSFKRILCYGVTGSGKTTFAKNLAEITGISFYEVDNLTWEPNWTEVSLDVQRDKVATICRTDEWILDSAYGKWLDIPLERVELIIGLDYSRSISLSRLILRSIKRAYTGELACNGNKENWAKLLSFDSIILWHFRSFKSKKIRLDQFAEHPGISVIRFKHPKDAESFLTQIKR